MLDNEDGLTRTPSHVISAGLRDISIAVTAAVAAATAASAIALTTVSDAATAGLGMDDTATDALQVLVNTTDDAIHAITGALAGLPNP